MNSLYWLLLALAPTDAPVHASEPAYTSAQRTLMFGSWADAFSAEKATPDAAAPPPRLTLPETSPDSPATSACVPCEARSTRAYTPPMFGDLIGKFGIRFLSVDGGPFAIRRVPILATSGGIKAAESESPRPTDRVYYSYNFFANTTVDVDPAVPPISVNRHVIGVEKTFLGNFASVGLRIPFVNLTGYPEITQANFADMSVVAKLALVNNPQTGNVLSGGMVLSVPTGPDYILEDPNTERTDVFHPVQLQPFIGWILNAPAGRLFAHGFTSIIVPTDGRDVTVFFNDVGVGYWLYQPALAGQLIQGVIPTFELHVNTPLNHRGAFQRPIGFPDIVNFTTGGYVLFRRAVLGVAAGVPASWPRVFSFEVLTTFSLRF